MARYGLGKDHRPSQKAAGVPRGKPNTQLVPLSSRFSASPLSQGSAKGSGCKTRGSASIFSLIFQE